MTSGSGAHGAPLDDLTVVDLSIARAGPTAVRYLADWGARVVRVESVGSDWSAPGLHETADYLNLHRSKTMVDLDLHRDDDRERFYELVDDADVLVENFRAPVKYKLGIDYATLAARNPRLVYGSISGYGQDGPAWERGAVDQIIQGVSGLMSVTGEPGAGPLRVGIAVSDMAAGHQLAIGILVALHERERTGRGQWVRVSLLEAMISFLDFQAARYTIDGVVPTSEGNHHPTSRPMGTYLASDGFFNVAAPTKGLWERLCHAIDRPELVADERFTTNTARYAHRDELNAELDACFRTRTRGSVGADPGAGRRPERAGARDGRGLRRTAGAAPGDAQRGRPPHARNHPRVAQPDHDEREPTGAPDGLAHAGNTGTPRRRDPATRLNP